MLLTNQDTYKFRNESAASNFCCTFLRHFEENSTFNDTVMSIHKLNWKVPPDWLQWFLMASMPVVFILGILGNTMAFIILKESARRNSSHFYLLCLSIFDTLTLLSLMITVYTGIILTGYYHELDEHDNWIRLIFKEFHFCRSRIYLSFVFRTVSVWIIVTFSCERCYAVRHPLFVDKRPMRRALMLILIVIIISCLLNSYVVFGYKNNKGECKASAIFKIGRLVSLLFHSVIPWFIVLICNTILVRHLRRNDNRQLTEEEKLRRGTSRTITLRLLAVSLTFLITTFPLLITSTGQSYYYFTSQRQAKGKEVMDWMWHLAFLPFTLNFSCNFILYCLTGKKFRLAAFYILTFRYEKMREVRHRMYPIRPLANRRNVTRPSRSTHLTSVLLKDSMQVESVCNYDEKMGRTSCMLYNDPQIQSQNLQV